MASEAIKRMFMERMFSRQDAQRAGELASNIFGRMGTSKDVHRPDPSSPFGLMNVETEETPATGLFERGISEQDKYTRASRQLVESGSPVLQKQGLSMMSGMQGNLMSGAGYDPKTFAYGAGDGKMQRGFLQEGEVQPIGQPYDPRSPFLDVGTRFVDPNDPSRDVQKELAQAEYEKKKGVAQQAFYEDYIGETATIEGSVYENNETKRLLNEMSGLVKHDTAGFGSWLRTTPLTDATYVSELKSTIQSRLALAKMMSLKSASSTGSTGFGALSEKELKLLTDFQGSLALAQDPKDIKRVLMKIYNHLEHQNSMYDRKLQSNKAKYIQIHNKRNPLEPLPESVTRDIAQPPAGDGNTIIRNWGE